MMSDHTPSQAEGDPDEPDNTDHPAPPHPTPSQAEGDRDDTDAESQDSEQK
ncbi:hypothetical protein ACIO93_20855 [Streptomyces sp. NPDC087903]|uniref:hypothetical protein n=1 Tax=Streptomyces sp. NPDC087903 TaxID=3365819 RepID=UPI00380A58C6